MHLIMYAYVHPHICLYVIAMNGSDDTRDMRDELGFFYYGTHTTKEVLIAVLKMDLD